MSASQRRKGANGERELAGELRSVFPGCSRRAAGEESQGDRGRDLKGTGEFVIQCQVGGRLTPLAKLEEAAAATAPHEIPVAALRLSTRKRQSQWVALVLLSDFKLMIAAYLAEKERAGVSDSGARITRGGPAALDSSARAGPERENGGEE